MKRLLLALAASLILSQTACERMPASKTVPGYAEKLEERQAREAEKATTAEPIDPAPPRFFPSGE